MVEVSVVPAPVPGCWAVSCTRHGLLPWVWTNTTLATWDALGHTAAHHAIPSK